MQALQRNAVPTEHAAQFGKLPVQFGGRIMPMNTFSSDLLRKVHKQNRIGDLDSDQFLLGLLTMPQIWMQVPLIANSNEELARMLGLPEGSCYAQLFDPEGNYKLLAHVNEAYKPESQRNELDKDIIKLDEKVNILFLLLNHKLMAIFPNENETGHDWYAPGDDLLPFTDNDSFVSTIFSSYLSEVRRSLENGDWQQPQALLDSIAGFQRKGDRSELINPKKIEAEIRYNSQQFDKARNGYLLLGFLLLVVAFYGSSER